MHTRKDAKLLLLFWGTLLPACDGLSSDPGHAALLRVSGAQYYPGPLPAADPQGPGVATVVNTNGLVRPGQSGKLITGTLAPPGQAVTIGLVGDLGYWLVPAGVHDLLSPEQLIFQARLAFSPRLPIGPLQLQLQAIDAQGSAGAAQSLALRVATFPDAPTGSLVISLRWEHEADLDLHVVDPTGIEIWARNINSYTPPPPGQPGDPKAVAAGGILDFDSNAQCLIDGLRQENVVWKQTAPAGHYLVRVATASLCGEVLAPWTLTVVHDGASVVQASGQSTDYDARYPNQAGAGVTAAEFELP